MNLKNSDVDKDLYLRINAKYSALKDKDIIIKAKDHEKGKDTKTNTFTAKIATIIFHCHHI